MNRELKQNMCELPDGVTNAEVEDLKERTQQHIDKALEYACRSWHKHLDPTISTQKPEITRVLHRFLERKFLFWLEALSILGAAREAVDALEATEKWLDVCCVPSFIFLQRLIGPDLGLANSRHYQGLFSFRTRILRCHQHVRAAYLHLSAPPVPPNVDRARAVQPIRMSFGEGCAGVVDLVGSGSCDFAL